MAMSRLKPGGYESAADPAGLPIGGVSPAHTPRTSFVPSPWQSLSVSPGLAPEPPPARPAPAA
jgi:hypothetical protein